MEVGETYGRDSDFPVCVGEIVNSARAIESEEKGYIRETGFASRYALEVFQNDDVPRAHCH